MTEKTFIPTAAQKKLKMMLHKQYPINTLQSWTPHEIEARQIAPTPLPLFRRWCKENVEFWDWLLTPMSESEDAYDAKQAAYKFLIELFETPHTTAEGESDAALLKAKMDAAKMLIGSNEKGIVINNNQTSQQMNLPKGFKNKPPEAIEGKILQLAGEQL